MIHRTIDTETPRGWFVGPWNSTVPIPVGFDSAGDPENHYHAQMYEVYLVARGTSVALVESATILLRAGDMLVLEPGEVHTFIENSEDYLHFVLQVPFVPGDKVLVDPHDPTR